MWRNCSGESEIVSRAFLSVYAVVNACPHRLTLRYPTTGLPNPFIADIHAVALFCYPVTIPKSQMLKISRQTLPTAISQTSCLRRQSACRSRPIRLRMMAGTGLGFVGMATKRQTTEPASGTVAVLKKFMVPPPGLVGSLGYEPFVPTTLPCLSKM